jgi:NitT/TauT family transport system permease protein
MRRLINRRPSRGTGIILTALPFVLLIAAYLIGSDIRLAENPRDKLLPSLSSMGAAIQEMAFTEDRRSGKYLLWSDTAESLRRLGVGMVLATLIGLTLGIGIGLIPLLRRALSQFVATICLIPPLAILPILFIVFGLGEVAKVALIVLGTAPVITRDIAQRVSEIPAEQLVKAQTLGANTWQIVMRLALPQALPRLVVAVRLSLGAAWLFLISSEAIAATDGLGYRIFLVRRYLAMDIIIPYVAWITLLAFVIDQALRILSVRAFRWSHLDGETL